MNNFSVQDSADWQGMKRDKLIRIWPPPQKTVERPGNPTLQSQAAVQALLKIQDDPYYLEEIAKLASDSIPRDVGGPPQPLPDAEEVPGAVSVVVPTEEVPAFPINPVPFDVPPGVGSPVFQDPGSPVVQLAVSPGVQPADGSQDSPQAVALLRASGSTPGAPVEESKSWHWGLLILLLVVVVAIVGVIYWLSGAKARERASEENGEDDRAGDPASGDRTGDPATEDRTSGAGMKDTQQGIEMGVSDAKAEELVAAAYREMIGPLVDFSTE